MASRTPLRPYLRSLLFALVLCAVILPVRAHVPPGATILFTGHLNADCRPDTVVGKEFGKGVWLPDMIVWGRDTTIQCDSSVMHPAGTPQPPVTGFTYPNWTDLNGSVAFGPYNLNDSLQDIILYLWGTSPNTGLDTARFLLLFGQRALDTLGVIQVAQIDSAFQSEPFIALDIDYNYYLTDPKVRDLTGVESYELRTADMVVVPVDTSGGGGTHMAAPRDSLTTTVSVYPNPTELGARLQSSRLEPGTYTITVLAVNGQEYHRQTVQISAPEQLERELDLHNLPTGTYIVRLHKDGRVLGSHPIIVIR